MSKKASKPFSGSIQKAFSAYLHNDPQRKAGNFWHSDAIATAVENAENALKSLHVLRKHIPDHFHELIRFSQPNITWYINVEKSIVATQLNRLLDDLLIRIARDIGYAPRIRVTTQPSHTRWQQSGFPLSFTEKIAIELPDEDDAQEIISQFIKS